jgi:hypothetical protein
MLRSFCTAMLLSAAAAQAGTSVGPTWTATDPLFTYPVAGNSLVWTWSGPGGPLSVSNTPAFSGFAEFSDRTYTTFAANAGYRITGYSLVYDLSFQGGTYLITGLELADIFGDLGPGDTFVGDGTFTTTSGQGATLTATGPTSAILVHHLAGPDFFVDFTLRVRGLAEFCASGDTFECTRGIGLSWLVSTLNLNSILITPEVVPIPEPSAYALLLAGLALLVARLRVGASAIDSTKTTRRAKC